MKNPYPFAAFLVLYASSLCAATEDAGDLQDVLRVVVRNENTDERRIEWKPGEPVAVAPGDRVRILGTDIAQASLARNGGNLVVTSAEGDVLVFEGFYGEVSGTDAPPYLEMVGVELPDTPTLRIVASDGSSRTVMVTADSAIDVGPGDTVTLMDGRTEDFDLRRRGSDLLIYTVGCEVVTLRGFFALLDEFSEPPSLVFGPVPVPAPIVLAMLEPNTAAGIRATGPSNVDRGSDYGDASGFDEFPGDGNSAAEQGECERHAETAGWSR